MAGRSRGAVENAEKQKDGKEDSRGNNGDETSKTGRHVCHVS